MLQKLSQPTYAAPVGLYLLNGSSRLLHHVKRDFLSFLSRFFNSLWLRNL